MNIEQPTLRQVANALKTILYILPFVIFFMIWWEDWKVGLLTTIAVILIGFILMIVDIWG